MNVSGEDLHLTCSLYFGACHCYKRLPIPPLRQQSMPWQRLIGNISVLLEEGDKTFHRYFKTVRLKHLQADTIRTAKYPAQNVSGNPGNRIWTCNPLRPKQVLYQIEPYPDNLRAIIWLSEPPKIHLSRIFCLPDLPSEHKHVPTVRICTSSAHLNSRPSRIRT